MTLEQKREQFTAALKNEILAQKEGYRTQLPGGVVVFPARMPTGLEVILLDREELQVAYRRTYGDDEIVSQKGKWKVADIDMAAMEAFSPVREMPGYYLPTSVRQLGLLCC